MPCTVHKNKPVRNEENAMNSSLSHRSRDLVGNLNTTHGTNHSLWYGISHETRGEGGVVSYLNITVDGELTGGQGTNHEETSTDTSEATTKTKLLSNLDQSAGRSLTGETLCLVDLG